MTFFNLLKNDLSIEFGEDQKSSVLHFEGPALTLAIPGSGKTTLMLARALYLSEIYHVDPKSILNLTFSKAAASDMNERYTNRFRSHFPYNFQFSTIHGFSYKILTQIWKENGTTPKKLLSHNREFLVRASEKCTASRLTDDQFETLSNQISYARNMLFSRGTLKSNGLDYPKIDDISEAYEYLKQEQHVIDFDDMLLMTLKTMQEDTSILDRLKRRFPFVQIDEAQDTSKVQHEILKRLVFPANNLFIVADDDQSIYGFRGASPDLLMSFQAQFPGGKLFHLSKNYRSRKEIIDVCSHVICNNQTRYEKTFSAIRGSGGSFKLKEFETYSDRNTAMLEDLKKIPASSCAILYRNHLSGLSIMDALIEAGQSFHIESGRRLISHHWLIKDMEAFYRLSYAPSDLDAFLRIVFKTDLRLTREAVETLQLNHRGRDVFEVALEVSGRKGYASERIRRVQSDIARLKQLRAIDFLETVDGTLGYSGYLQYAETSLGQSADHIRSLWFSLLAIANRFDSTADFFERLKVLDHYKSTEKDSKISLSTLHASKGREFDHVQLIDVISGIFPASDISSSEKDRLALEEERRLFYVGISRARESVTLFHARFGGGRRLPLSIFIKEILPVIEHITPPKNNVISKESPVGLSLGAPARHQKFGSCTVLSIEGDAITLQFEDKIRTLSLRLCLEKEFLTFY